MKKRIFSILFSVVLAITLCATPVLADEPESESGLLPPSIMPVIIIQGSDYEMGYQYAQQTAELFDLSVLRKMQGEFTDDQILALKAYQWYIKKQTPEVIEMFKGMADGATDAGVKLSYAEVLAFYAAGRMGLKAHPGTEPAGSGADMLPPAACSQWAAWGDTTIDGGLVCGCCDDWSFIDFVVTVALPDDGNSYMLMGKAGRTLAGQRGWSGMNNKGVWFSSSLGGSTNMADFAGGYDASEIGLNQHVLRYCNTAEEAKDMFLSFEFCPPFNRLVADTSGDAYVLEVAASFKEVRRPGDFGEGDFIYATNTYLTDKGGEANLAAGPGYFTEHGGWCMDPLPGKEGAGGYGDLQLCSVARNLTIYNMLNGYQGYVDADFGKMMYRFTGEAPNDPSDTLEFRANKAKGWETIGNLNNAQVAVALPDNGDGGRMYICTGPAGRVAYPLYPPDSAVFQIDGTHSFCELTLASDTATIVGIAEATSKRYIQQAYQELMWLNYGDVGFEGLNELFSQANTEYYEGENWLGRARATGGNDAVLYYAQAATAFTKSQAHAAEIYNALVPPATTPEDLGLRSYTYEKKG
jgi:hypothetical protein